MSGTRTITRYGKRRLIVKADHNECYVEVVPGKKRTYLWIGDDESCYLTVSGEATLRKLAMAIFAEVGGPA